VGGEGGGGIGWERVVFDKTKRYFHLALLYNKIPPAPPRIYIGRLLKCPLIKLPANPLTSVHPSKNIPKPSGSSIFPIADNDVKNGLLNDMCTFLCLISSSALDDVGDGGGHLLSSSSITPDSRTILLNSDTVVLERVQERRINWEGGEEFAYRSW
jgi:hypothetical protein